MPPHLTRTPSRCDVTRVGGLPVVEKLRNMDWSRWAPEGARGQGRVGGNKSTTIRFKRTRPCGPNGEQRVYSKMSINGRPFHPVLRGLRRPNPGGANSLALKGSVTRFVRTG